MQSVDELKELCKLIRFNILTATTEAGSGHPTSSLSAVELGVTLFFGGFFHQDLENPHDVSNDRFVLSKGHASPLLYSLYQAAGAITRDELLSLRKFGSKIEGHPTPEFLFTEVATGSLGQGLSIGLGMALGINLRLSQTDAVEEERSDGKTVSVNGGKIPKVFVLMGDSEFSEGQIYEALQLASYYKMGNLIGILDVNRLGQRGETMLGWNLKTYEDRIASFGWQTIVIEDGHNIEQIQKAYASFDSPQDRQKPKMVIAKTIKGKDVSFLENQDDWHGKPVPKDKLEVTLKELGSVNINLKGEIKKPL